MLLLTLRSCGAAARPLALLRALGHRLRARLRALRLPLPRRLVPPRLRRRARLRRAVRRHRGDGALARRLLRRALRQHGGRGAAALLRAARLPPARLPPAAFAGLAALAGRTSSPGTGKPLATMSRGRRRPRRTYLCVLHEPSWAVCLLSWSRGHALIHGPAIVVSNSAWAAAPTSATCAALRSTSAQPPHRTSALPRNSSMGMAAGFISTLGFSDEKPFGSPARCHRKSSDQRTRSL